jgi:[glutamine synthetase] adenylyltransferase / [glutamine synthetase]-adenylyl-L-tyrosine phosphorylase
MKQKKQSGDKSVGFVERIAAAPVPADRARAAAFVDDLVAAAAKAGCEPLSGAIADTAPLSDLLTGALDGSPWLRGVIVADPELAARIVLADPDAHLDELCAKVRAEVREAEDRAAAMTALRRFKTEAAVLVALCDLGAVWDVDTVIAAMTRIADTAVQTAAERLLREAADRGDLAPQDADAPERGSGWIILAMGKHGAGELNFSSDIDLIVIYDAARAPLTDPDNAAKIFVRLTRDLVKLLNEYTGDGYVFRTDLRLRPDPGATSVAISLDAALEYYESLGQNWERAALLKARPVAGDTEAGERFLHEIAPFIWRKYMDFAALADVHAMKRQIHAHKGHGTIAVRGHNIKLGRGGIREIEFFVQTQQLVAGGRHPDLRARPTLVALDRLRKSGWIVDTVRDELAAAYRYLRRIEHRIQMVADEQHHSLPEDEAAFEAFACFAGYETAEALAEDMLGHMRAVQRHYAQLFEGAPELSATSGNLVFTGDDDDPDTVETLSGMGFERPREVIAAIRSWHYGRIAATRSARAREVLTEITPALLDALSDTANPDGAFLAFDSLVGRLPAGVQVFTLLRTNPHILGLLAEILGTAPRLAELLGRRPNIFAALLEPDFFDALPDRTSLEAHLDETLGEAQSYEDALDRARIFGQEQSFLIGVRVLSGTVSATDTGSAFTRLAELLVARMHMLAKTELARRHGTIPGGQSAVLAMGKLGSGEMTYSSDLDLILLYDCESEEITSDGDRPLGPTQYYARLTQRLVAALSAPTAEGALYEVDMRLRPSGRAGPVATRIDSFADYQKSEAWTWEHMALTRARMISGPDGLRQRIETIIREILTTARDREKLAADIVDMRARIHREKGSTDPWELKTVVGGLIDIEFIAQFLQLAHGAEHPGLLHQGTAASLSTAREAGLLSRGDAEILVPAHTLYEAVTEVLRLCVSGSFETATCPRGLASQLAKVADVPDLPRLESELRETHTRVREVFVRLIGDPEAL